MVWLLEWTPALLPPPPSIETTVNFKEGLVSFHMTQLINSHKNQVQVGGEEGVGHPAYVLSILSDLGTLIDQRFTFCLIPWLLYKCVVTIQEPT